VKYRTLEVLGPEHEFSLVDERLNALSIVDRVLKDFHGRVVNFVELPKFSFRKELQLHVMEVKANKPFASPVEFEQTMHCAVKTLQEFVNRRYGARLLGMGMHPLLKLDETRVWPHHHRQLYEEYSKVFNLKRHGWLNIQSFQLNLPYSDQKSGIMLHNLLANICPYLPAVSATSPIFEGKFGRYVDNRLHFYEQNQKEVPSVTGDVIPEYISSFKHYEEDVIGKYSRDLAARGIGKLLVGKEWVNSRATIFRFDRKALEIRVMDEQECVKSDVALGCYMRALLRGLLTTNYELAPHEILVEDLDSVIERGSEAKTKSKLGDTARDACKSLLKIAFQNATGEEKEYLPIIEKRIRSGNLSEVVRSRIKNRSQKTELKEAIIDVFLKLSESLIDNKPYF